MVDVGGDGDGVLRDEGRWKSGNETREKLGEGVGGIFQRGKKGDCGEGS